MYFQEVNEENNFGGDLTEFEKQKLDKMLESFITSNVFVRQKKYKNAKKKVLFLVIKLSSIKKLKLSELEQIYVIQYLNNKGIEVIDDSLENVFDDCGYYRISGKQILPFYLTDEEVYEKVCLYQQTKNQVFKEQLVLFYARVISHIAFNYAKFYGIDVYELESYGYEGVLEAINKFNPILEYKFQAYVINYIDGYIKRGCQEILTGKVDNFSAAYIKIKRIVERNNATTLEDDFELISEVVDLLSACGVRKRKNRELLERKVSLMNICYLDDVDNNLMVDTDTSYEFDELVSRIDRDIFRKKIDFIFELLTPREKAVLRLRFGFLDGVCYTLEEIGKKLSITKQAVSLIEKKILDKIRNSTIYEKLEHAYFYHDVNEHGTCKKI